jgi:hypothetical protein
MVRKCGINFRAFVVRPPDGFALIGGSSSCYHNPMSEDYDKISGDEREYIELKDRINQDVMHDNFVPKYSALASAEPKLLVVIGVWLIFAPMAVFFTGIGISQLFDAGVTLSSALLNGSILALCAGLGVTILWQQTRRYIARRRGSGE